MFILTVRTDKPTAEIGLYKDAQKLAYVTWQAHRQLAETLHKQIAGLLKSQHNDLNDLGGLIVFKGPGSFTGLRIGASVANALAAALNLKIIGAVGEDWIEQGLKTLNAGLDDKQVVPEYGAEARTTTQKK